MALKFYSNMGSQITFSLIFSRGGALNLPEFILSQFVMIDIGGNITKISKHRPEIVQHFLFFCYDKSVMIQPFIQKKKC